MESPLRKSNLTESKSIILLQGVSGENYIHINSLAIQIIVGGANVDKKSYFYSDRY